jgi:hypothetical protein
VLAPTLSGAMVAYGEGRISPFERSEDYVVVQDLRTGRTIYHVPTGTEVNPIPGDVGVGEVAAVVVKADGSVAWIVQTTRENGRYQVHADDKSGSRLLAEGPDIAPRSLALAGSTLYWTEAGRPSLAALN